MKYTSAKDAKHYGTTYLARYFFLKTFFSLSLFFSLNCKCHSNECRIKEKGNENIHLQERKSLRHVCRTDLSVGSVLSTIQAPVCRLERQDSFLQVGNTREVLIGTIDRVIVGETPAS